MYLLNSTLIGLETVSYVLLLGTNPRLESPLLNSRLRKNYLNSNNSLKVYSLGLSLDFLTYPVLNLGNSLKSLSLLCEGKFNLLREILFNKMSYFNEFQSLFFKPSIFLGMFLLNRVDFSDIFNSLSFFIKNYIKSEFRSLNILSNNLGRLSSFELGFIPSVYSKFSYNFSKSIKSFCFFVGVDDFIFKSKDSFLVYQGSFRDTVLSFKKADLIFPVSTYVERISFFINLEGRIRNTKKVLSNVTEGSNFNDSEVINALFLYFKQVKLDNFSKISNFYSIMSKFNNIINYKCQIFSNLDLFFNRLSFVSGLTDTFNINLIVPYLINIISLNMPYKFLNGIFVRSVQNFYSTDVFTRNSKVMSLCSLKSLNLSFSKL